MPRRSKQSISESTAALVRAARSAVGHDEPQTEEEAAIVGLTPSTSSGEDQDAMRLAHGRYQQLRKSASTAASASGGYGLASSGLFG
jgi:hypothetical protein